MAGLAFDDSYEVDPQTSLVGPFREWVDILAARRSEATASGYVSDAAVFARMLRHVVAKPAPADIVDLEGFDVPPTLVRGGRPAVPLLTYRRAEAAMDGLVLADLHPRNCARALDALGSTRKAASQRRMASAWASLCRLLVRRGLLAANPMDHDAVERPSRPSPSPAPLDYSDAERLLATILDADDRARDPWPVRDFALAAVLMSSGLRVGEAVSVCVGDLRAVAVAPRLEVLGKGGKRRTLPLHPDTLAAVEAYFSERTERVGALAGSDPLFVRADGSAFTARAMRRLVERWYVRSGARRRPGACVHALRHTFATAALDSGASVVEVQKLLGHESLDTTKVYLAVVGSGLEDTVARHPMAIMVAAARAPLPEPVPDHPQDPDAETAAATGPAPVPPVSAR